MVDHSDQQDIKVCVSYCAHLVVVKAVNHFLIADRCNGREVEEEQLTFCWFRSTSKEYQTGNGSDEKQIRFLGQWKKQFLKYIGLDEEKFEFQPLFKEV